MNKLGRPPRKVPEGERWCGFCQESHSVLEFTANERTCRTGKYLYHIFRAYGLSKEEYSDLREKQGKWCACCKVRAWRHVDHDHLTGRPRKLLCPGCNTLVGFRETNPEIFEQIDNYLAENGLARNHE